MRFDLDHDWQGNLSTPRAKVGEKSKTHLLILLCAIWLCMGLVGHAPWKPYESNTISTITTVLETNNLLAPSAASSNQITHPPLYFIVAAGFAKLLGFTMPMHDAARISTGFWMLITLLMMGMAGRELWGRGVGRQTAFILIGSLGLVVSAHTLFPNASALAAVTTGFYALSLAQRRPYRAGLLLGASLAVGFLSTGLVPFLLVFLSGLTLASLFMRWRNIRFAKVFALGLALSSPFILGWAFLANHYYHDTFQAWWVSSMSLFKQTNHLYFLRTLLWFAWPALPLAIWGAWRYRNLLLTVPRFQLILTFLIVSWLVLGFGSSNEVRALPLLIPLSAMAGGSIETLKRGVAGAFNWFGLILFGLITLLIWLGWAAMLTGQPAKIKERMSFLSGMSQLNFSMLAFIIAAAITLIWLTTLFRAQHSNRATATNWAIGMTCAWTLLMTIWLPMIDSARSYASVFTQIKRALPPTVSCVKSQQLGSAQLDLLHYYANIRTVPAESEQSLTCNVWLIQDEKGRENAEPGSDWRLVWSGKRASERKESFRLFQSAN